MIQTSVPDVLGIVVVGLGGEISAALTLRQGTYSPSVVPCLVLSLLGVRYVLVPVAPSEEVIPIEVGSGTDDPPFFHVPQEPLQIRGILSTDVMETSERLTPSIAILVQRPQSVALNAVAQVLNPIARFVDLGGLSKLRMRTFLWAGAN